MANQVLLKELMRPKQVVAAIDEMLDGRKDIVQELKPFGVDILELPNVESLAQTSGVGAIIYGLQEITHLNDIQAACEEAVRFRAPMVVMTTHLEIPQKVLDQVFGRYNSHHGGVPIELVAGRHHTPIAIELLAEGLLEMRKGESQSRKHRKFETHLPQNIFNRLLSSRSSH